MDQAALLHRIINRPEQVAALAPGFDGVTLPGFIENPNNVFLGDENGAAIFAMRFDEPGVYEGHYLLVPGRADNVERCRDFLRTMFTEHGAQAIWGFVSSENRAARALSRALGFAPRGYSTSPSGRSCVNYVLERTRWEKS